MQQINIVISGFTPYEGIDVNPAVLVPAAVAKQWADPAQSQAISEELLQDIAVTVTNVTLPVSFANAWPTLLEAIEQANRYAETDTVKCAIGATELHKIVVVYKGMEMRVCEEV